MSTIQRTTLGFMALCLVAIWAYALSYVAYGLLERVSADWVWAGGMAIMLSLYIAYAKRILKHLSTLKHDDEPDVHPDLIKEYEALADGMARLGYQGGAPSTLDVEALERSVHSWKQRGDTPGSLAGSVIGLDAADAYLEGDM